MSARVPMLLLAALMGCGPRAATYEVDLILVERCTLRGEVESCEQPADTRTTKTLIVEPRGEQVLVLLGDRLFVADDVGGSLQAQRDSVHSALETGCERQQQQRLQLQPGFGVLHGTLETRQVTDGPVGPCGQTPFGETLSQELVGTEIEEP